MRLFIFLLVSLSCFFPSQSSAITAYFTDSNPDQVSRSFLCGGIVETLVPDPLAGGDLNDIEIDIAGGKIYWIDRIDFLRRSNLDGSNVEELTDSLCGVDDCNAVGLGLDLIANKMYWSKGPRIRRTNTDGSMTELIVTDVDGPINDVEVDAAGGKVYWVNAGDDTIKRSNLDGSSIQTLVSGLTPNAGIGLALDPANGKMYWTDHGADKIQRANLNGSSVQDVITGLTSFLVDIEVDAVHDHIYFTASSSGMWSIYRANLDGSGLVTVLESNDVYWLALDPTYPVGSPAISITKEASVTTVNPGDTVTYAIEVVNTGDTCLESIEVEDVLPPELAYISATPMPNSTGGGTQTWLVDDLSLGQSLTFELVAQVSTNCEDSGQSLSNTACVDALGDGSPVSDCDSYEIDVIEIDCGPCAYFQTTLPLVNQSTIGEDGVQTFDGGYVVAGYASGSAIDAHNVVHIHKLDEEGVVQWSSRYGDNDGEDVAKGIIEDAGGNLIVVGNGVKTKNKQSSIINLRSDLSEIEEGGKRLAYSRANDALHSQPSVVPVARL